MDMIDALPPGLYEAVITKVDADTANPDLIEGRYLFRLETRKLDDIRALGGNDAADERRFAAAARVSEINHGLYETYVAPVLRGHVPEPVAEASGQLIRTVCGSACSATRIPSCSRSKGWQKRSVPIASLSMKIIPGWRPNA